MSTAENTFEQKIVDEASFRATAAIRRFKDEAARAYGRLVLNENSGHSMEHSEVAKETFRLLLDPTSGWGHEQWPDVIFEIHKKAVVDALWRRLTAEEPATERDAKQ